MGAFDVSAASASSEDSQKSVITPSLEDQKFRIMEQELYLGELRFYSNKLTGVESPEFINAIKLFQKESKSQSITGKLNEQEFESLRKRYWSTQPALQLPTETFFKKNDKALVAKGIWMVVRDDYSSVAMPKQATISCVFAENICVVTDVFVSAGTLDIYAPVKISQHSLLIESYQIQSVTEDKIVALSQKQDGALEELGGITSGENRCIASQLIIEHKEKRVIRVQEIIDPLNDDLCKITKEFREKRHIATTFNLSYDRDALFESEYLSRINQNDYAEDHRVKLSSLFNWLMKQDRERYKQYLTPKFKRPSLSVDGDVK
jgi:hypothetical protein